MPVPLDWETSTENASVRDNAIDGSIKTVIIKNRGVGLGTANRTYTRVPIKGDGSGAECTVVINNDQQVDSVTISNQGKDYSFGNVDLVAGNVPTGTTIPTLDVIISPPGGSTEKTSTENLVHQMHFSMPELKMMMRIQILSLVIKLQELELLKIQKHIIQPPLFHYQKQVLFMRLD